MGSRSFYLRSSSRNRRSNGGSASSITETVSGRANPPPPPPIPCPPFLLPEFFASKFGKIVRRTLQLWKVLVSWKWHQDPVFVEFNSITLFTFSNINQDTFFSSFYPYFIFLQILFGWRWRVLHYPTRINYSNLI